MLPTVTVSCSGDIVFSGCKSVKSKYHLVNTEQVTGQDSVTVYEE